MQGDVGLGRVLSLETRVSAEAIPSDTPGNMLSVSPLIHCKSVTSDFYKFSTQLLSWRRLDYR